QRAPADAQLSVRVHAAAVVGGQVAVRRPAAIRLSAPRPDRVPGPRPRLPGPVRAGAGHQLGGAAPGGDRLPHTVIAARPQTVRDENNPVLAVSSEPRALASGDDFTAG